MSNRTLAKKLASVKPGTLFVGVDLAKSSNVAVVLTEHKRRLDRFSFPNDRDGYDYFYRRLDKSREQEQAPAIIIGMEPTNYFWKLLAADLEEHHPEHTYRLVNPYTVKKVREGTQLDRSKDDNRDGETIGGLMIDGRYTYTQLLHASYAELREYGKIYYRIQRDIKRQKTFINNIAGQLFPELTREFKDLSGLTATAMLRNHGAAAVIREIPEQDFIDAVREDFRGQKLGVSRLHRAYASAQRSVGLTDGIAAFQQALHMHIETLEMQKKQLETLEESFVDVFLHLPEADYMLSIDYLGVITAAKILAEIGDPGNYTQARQWIKLAGTQPVPNTSGRKTRSRTPISHKGRSQLRTTLYFAVLQLIQKDPAFAQVYQHFQIRKKNPLTKMQAVVAVMNKLLRVLWALIQHQTYYDPELLMAR